MMLQRRQRIVNQIELAFVKEKREAVNFISCDNCSAPAAILGLTHENPGSQIIDTDQISGAWCGDHSLWIAHAPASKPFKTTTYVPCSRLEFFYDGLRQICLKAKT